MDRKLSVVANVRYQTPKGKGAGKLKGLLRYIQYRDDRDGHIPQHEGLERWVDHGLGRNFQTIAANCEAFKSEHVQAFTFVINPNPDLVGFIPDEHRVAFVQELTETTIEQFFEARGLDTPDYAFAIHRRETTDANQPGRDNPHAHVILPGTYESWADGERLPLYMNQNKHENHIELLHTIAQQQIDVLLQREVGLDWEQRYDAFVEQARQEAILALSLERQPELPIEPTQEPTVEPGLPDDPEPERWSGPSFDL